MIFRVAGSHLMDRTKKLVLYSIRKSARDAALYIPAVHRLRDSRDALLAERDALRAELDAAQADIATLRSEIGPFFHYKSVFDAVTCILRDAAPDLQPCPGCLTNHLGVIVDPKCFPDLLDGREREVEGPPIPGNWHADMAEFAAALRAVDLSRDCFTMIELGCGWGCWMNNTGVAARRAGRKVHLIGVEADEGHIGFAKESCATNGFSPSSVNLYHGIAAATSGTALFPRQDRASVCWGLEPVFGATEAQRQQAVASGSYHELPMIAIADLIAPHERIDFLHVDIQGGEADLIESCLTVLRERVAYMFVGTHSRQIEGRLFQALLQGGWLLEVERAGLLKLGGTTPHMWVDGA